jgi:ribosomal protein S18 acetylase RimI-like enzyme
MIIDDSQARADQNLFDAFRIMVTCMPKGEARERDGLLVTASGLPTSQFNIAWVTRPLEKPRETLQWGTDYFDERRLPFIVRVRERFDTASEAAMQGLKLAYAESVPGMILADPGRRGNAVEGLTISDATDDDTLAANAALISASFGAPRHFARQLIMCATLGPPDTKTFTGYLNGKAVATCSLFVTGRVAGIFNVSTLPEARGRGIGEAITWHAVHAGAERGALIASLQASEMGRPIYQRMGFRLTANYLAFGRP